LLDLVHVLIFELNNFLESFLVHTYHLHVFLVMLVLLLHVPSIVFWLVWRLRGGCMGIGLLLV
jgi:hypothetical protein